MYQGEPEKGKKKGKSPFYGEIALVLKEDCVRVLDFDFISSLVNVIIVFSFALMNSYSHRGSPGEKIL